MREIHIPVLQKEIIHYLAPRPNKNFIDCTIGQGGHSLAILKKNAPQGKVLGIEWDPELYNLLQKKRSRLNIKQRLFLVNDSYTNLKEIVKKYNFKPVQGILFDLGVCSWHFKESKRGFSFQRDEILDMRYNPEKQKLLAKDILNSWPEPKIENILREYGQERFAKKIAKEVLKSREIKPVETTFQLVAIIKKAVPAWYCHQKIHFATKSFQALRIAVNNELSNLESSLSQALEILSKKGILVVISFHSLEDRIVKNFFRENRENLNILTKKPIRPSLKEIKINPQSRSAILRAAEKIKV